MKPLATYRHIMSGWLLLMVSAVLVILLTTLPRSTPPIGFIANVLDHTVMGDTIGHALLFACFTLIAYYALRQFLAAGMAFTLAVGGVLLMATLTETHQAVILSRASTESDLLANWFGVLFAAVWLNHRATLSRWG